jgi:hypothetical protein
LSGSEVKRYGSSGGASHGSSRIPASIERPNRFSSNENGELFVTVIGMPLASAYSTSSSRVQTRSRSGAITFTPG